MEKNEEASVQRIQSGNILTNYWNKVVQSNNNEPNKNDEEDPNYVLIFQSKESIIQAFAMDKSGDHFFTHEGKVIKKMSSSASSFAEEFSGHNAPISQLLITEDGRILIR
jgi:hypothetical protein